MKKMGLRGTPMYKDYIGDTLIVMLMMLMMSGMLMSMSLNKMMTMHMTVMDHSDKVEVGFDVVGEIREHL